MQLETRESLEQQKKLLLELLQHGGWKAVEDQLKAELRIGAEKLGVAASNLDGMIAQNSIAAAQESIKRFLKLPSNLLEIVEEDLLRIYQDEQ